MKRELCSIQCVHSISAIAALREEVASYVDEKYHLITFAKVYEPVVNLISGPTFWPRTEKPKVLPPKKLKLPGRPKKCRREDPDEEAETSKLTTKRVLRFGRIKSKCGNCGKQGYNMRTCTEKSKIAQVNEKVGIEVSQPSLEPSNENRRSKCKGLGQNKRTCKAIIKDSHNDKKYEKA